MRAQVKVFQNTRFKSKGIVLDSGAHFRASESSWARLGPADLAPRLDHQLILPFLLKLVKIFLHLLHFPGITKRTGLTLSILREEQSM